MNKFTSKHSNTKNIACNLYLKYSISILLTEANTHPHSMWHSITFAFIDSRRSFKLMPFYYVLMCGFTLHFQQNQSSNEQNFWMLQSFDLYVRVCLSCQ